MVKKKENYGIITLITVAVVSVFAGIIITEVRHYPAHGCRNLLEGGRR
jgi:hypothetical protein